MDDRKHGSQRKGCRLPVRLPYTLVASDAGRMIEMAAESINVSKAGARIKTEAQLTTGQTVEVTLSLGTPIPVVARVVWVGDATDPEGNEFGIEYVIPPRPV